MDIKIEKMLEEDLDLIDIAKFDDFWNMNILKEELMSDSSIYIISKSEDEISGFAGINLILDEAHIANIAVRKDMRGIGIGSKLLQELINIAKNKTKLITLEVSEKNPIAISLYKKYGFETLGKRKNYYFNKYDAYIMTKYFD